METKHINFPFNYELKTQGQEEGFFSGFGSTFDNIPDSYNDIVMKGAFKKTLEKGGRNGNRCKTDNSEKNRHGRA